MKDINYYKSKYPKVLRNIAINSDKNNIANLAEINNSMWLIECEETNNKEYPYCLYYHESGNIYGLTHFNDKIFLNACKSFLNTVWGITITE